MSLSAPVPFHLRACSLYPLSPALRHCKRRASRGSFIFFLPSSVCSRRRIFSVPCFNHQSITRRTTAREATFNGPHFICSFKIGFCAEVKQRRRALNREITRGDSGAGEGEARGPNTANEVLSHKTPLKHHNVIPICNFIIPRRAPLPSPTYTSPPPIIVVVSTCHRAAPFRIIRKHSH